MTDSQVSLARDHHGEEHRGAEAHVVEGVGELRDQVDPDQAVLRPGPREHYVLKRSSQSIVKWKKVMFPLRGSN